MSQVFRKNYPIVRPATSEDAAEIARIYNHYVRIGGSTFDVVQWPPEQVAELLKRGQDAWFVALDTDGIRLVGWASAKKYSDRYGYRHSCETAIYVDHEALGSAAASVLQERIHQHCQETKIHHAVARVVADNQRSISFHEKYGYEIVGTQKEIGRVDDRWVDVVIMQRIFDGSDRNA